ncbi:hypothetical protein IAT40_005610 [Kwoniella sp. CBS 6097]
MAYQPNHVFKGVVTKVGAMRKTATVTVERVFEHPKILKEIKRHKKYLVHDENEVARLDDKVTIIHGARTSRRKAFRLLSVDARDSRHGESSQLPSASEIGVPKLKPRKENERAGVVGGVLESLKELRGDGAGVSR